MQFFLSKKSPERVNNGGGGGLLEGLYHYTNLDLYLYIEQI